MKPFYLTVFIISANQIILFFAHVTITDVSRACCISDGWLAKSFARSSGNMASQRKACILLKVFQINLYLVQF